MNNNCTFCDIVSGVAPSHQIWEDESHLAFLSIFPNTHGFSVVTTKEHLDSDVAALPVEEYTGLMNATRMVALLLARSLEGVARAAIVAEGYGVNHAHTKLIPLHGTGSQERWTPVHSVVDRVFDEYPGYVSTHDAPRVPDEKLRSIAEQIRSGLAT